MSFSKIYSLTPNPALDLSGSAENIVPDEKNYVQGEKRAAGGNGVNAVRIIKRMGVKGTAGGFLGGVIGSHIKSLLEKEGVDADFIRIENESRVNITVRNEKNGSQTRFSFMGPRILAKEKQHLLKKVKALPKGTLVLLGGSYPPGFGLSDAKKILELCHERGLPVIVDVPSKNLKAILPAKPLMIKPNLHEFEQLTGKSLKSKNAIIREGRKMLKHCPLVLVSSVDKGVLMLCKQGAYFAKGPQIQAKSGVGAGDSMVGAIAAEMLRQNLSYNSFFDLGETKELPKQLWADLLSSGLGASLATVAQEAGKLGTKSSMKKYKGKIKVELLKSF